MQLKTKLNKQLNLGWSDYIFVLKRGIISIYQDDKELFNERQEDYIIINDIVSCNQLTNPKKLIIITK